MDENTQHLVDVRVLTGFQFEGKTYDSPGPARLPLEFAQEMAAANKVEIIALPQAPSAAPAVVNESDLPVRAIRGFQHGGRNFAPHDEFSMPPNLAREYMRIGKVELIDPSQPVGQPSQAFEFIDGRRVSPAPTAGPYPARVTEPAHEGKAPESLGHQSPGHQSPGHQSPGHQSPNAADGAADGWPKFEHAPDTSKSSPDGGVADGPKAADPPHAQKPHK